MKRLAIITTALVMVLAVFVVNAQAARKVIPNVPYIHQVMDMSQDQFLGHNACGPTSAVMMTQYHNLLQGMCPAGYYVYNQQEFLDKSGQDYSSKLAMDMALNQNHVHWVSGAHGFIVDNQDGYWGTIEQYLLDYLRNHGLTTPGSVSANLFTVIQDNIDNGLPLIAHGVVRGNGHYLVIVGYDTGSSGNEQNTVVYDPYGDAYGTWNGSTSGEGKIYPLHGSKAVIDRIIPVFSIGIYNGFPGWKSGAFPQKSQPFVDCYNEHGGQDTFGLPWSNGEGGPWVHQWPDGSISSNTVWVQDFLTPAGRWWQLVLNQTQNKVFAVHGRILQFWHSDWGYQKYGPPDTNEYAAKDNDGNLIVVQEFVKNGNRFYIGCEAYSSVTRLYSPYEINDRDYTIDPDFVIAITDSGGGFYDPAMDRAVAVSETMVYAVWNRGDNPPNYGKYTYEVYRNNRLIETTDYNSKFYEGHVPGETYCYKVRIAEDNAYSDFSNTVCVVMPGGGSGGGSPPPNEDPPEEDPPTYDPPVVDPPDDPEPEDPPFVAIDLIYDPVIYYTFEEDEGKTVVDRAGNGAEALIYNAWRSTGNKEAPFTRGKAMRFVGEKRFVTVQEYFRNLVSGDFTVIVMFKVLEANGRRQYIVWANDDRPGMRLTPDLRVEYLFKPSQKSSPLPNNPIGCGFKSEPIELNRWHVAAMGWDSQYFCGYLDGKLVGSVMLPEFILGSKLRIGQDSNNQRTFQGFIDEVMVFDTAPDLEQIKSVAMSLFTSLHYDFDQAGVSVVDQSGLNNHGAITGAEFAVGYNQNALDFSGEGNNLRAGTGMRKLADGPFTITALVYPEDFRKWQYIFHSDDDRPGIRLTEDNRVAVLHQPNARSYPLPNTPGGCGFTSEPISLHAWTFVALTWDGRYFTGYVNGEAFGSRELPGFRLGGRIMIGSDGRLVRSFQGLIDEVKVFSRALSAREIADMY